jgi:hypothetical protein
MYLIHALKLEAFPCSCQIAALASYLKRWNLSYTQSPRPPPICIQKNQSRCSCVGFHLQMRSHMPVPNKYACQYTVPTPEGSSRCLVKSPRSKSFQCHLVHLSHTSPRPPCPPPPFQSIITTLIHMQSLHHPYLCSST